MLFVPFWQSIFESAQNRSKKLGISNMSKVPLAESNVKVDTPSARTHDSRKPSSSSSPASPSKHRHQALVDRKPSSTSSSPSTKNRATSLVESKNTLSFDAKENDSVAIAINIATGPNVQVIGNCIFVSPFIPLKLSKL